MHYNKTIENKALVRYYISVGAILPNKKNPYQGSPKGGSCSLLENYLNKNMKLSTKNIDRTIKILRKGNKLPKIHGNKKVPHLIWDGIEITGVINVTPKQAAALNSLKAKE